MSSIFLSFAAVYTPSDLVRTFRADPLSRVFHSNKVGWKNSFYSRVCRSVSALVYIRTLRGDLCRNEFKKGLLQTVPVPFRRHSSIKSCVHHFPKRAGVKADHFFGRSVFHTCEIDLCCRYSNRCMSKFARPHFHRHKCCIAALSDVFWKQIQKSGRSYFNHIDLSVNRVHQTARRSGCVLRNDRVHFLLYPAVHIACSQAEK